MAEIIMNKTTVLFETYRLNGDRYVRCYNDSLNGRKYTDAKVVYDVRDVDCNGAKRTLHFVQINDEAPVVGELVRTKALKDGTLLLGICTQLD